MNSRNQKALMAGAILAAAFTTLGARAADQSDWFACERQISDGNYSDCQATLSPNRAATAPAQGSSSRDEIAVPSNRIEIVSAPVRVESPAFEAFEKQLGAGSVEDFTASEHPDRAR